jgi:cytochrome c oxidase subunit III
MSEPAVRVLDVSQLPTYGFSHRSLMWWGTLGLMAIEGTVFAMTVVSYFYLRARSPNWPMSALPPALLWGTLNTVILLVSLWPNHMAKKAAEAEQFDKVRIWLCVCVAIGLAFTAVRVMEFASLNVRWDSNAYGSVVWMLMGLHTTHLVTDVFDTAVLALLFFKGPVDRTRFVDESENALYWIFVVLTWLPIYLVVYWGGRTP